MRLTKAIMAIIFVISALACVPTSGIVDIHGRLARVIPYPPPPIYETWWKEIADCEHLPLPEDHTVSWAIVAVRPFFFAEDTTHTRLDAVIITPQTGMSRVFVNYSGILDRGLVTHEMAHALLFWKFGTKYVGQHPDPYYTQCGLIAEGQQKL